jgi:hypothetical protein
LLFFGAITLATAVGFVVCCGGADDDDTADTSGGVVADDDNKAGFTVFGMPHFLNQLY